MSAPTPGPWAASAVLTSSENHHGYVIRSADGWMLASVFPVDTDGKEGGANASLIAEAGTVYHETGLTPRQLAEQRAELLEALNAFLSAGIGNSTDFRLQADAFRLARAAIAKAGAA